MKRTVNILARLVSCVFVAVLVVMSSCDDDEVKRSNLTGITSFSLQGFSEKFTIDENALTISNTGADSLPYGTDVTALVAVFEAVPKSTVTVNGVAQESGVTPNDFTQPVTYKVTAEDGVTVKNYTVTVNVSKINPEAASWRRVTESASWTAWTKHFAATSFKGKLYAWGIESNSITGIPPHTFEVYTSEDGATWAKQTLTDQNGDPIPPTRDAGIVSGFQNKLWVIGGMVPTKPVDGGGFSFAALTNKVWSTSDGVTWTVTTPEASATIWTARERHIALQYDNKLWVIGGNGSGFGGSLGSPRNDVWSSTDGATWTQAVANAAFVARTDPAGVVHDNKMFIIGGRTSTNEFKNDVWYSTDGATWTEVTVATPFPGRARHKVISYDNKLWLIGGESVDGAVTTRYNDLWVSEDNGANWTKVESSDPLGIPASFKARCYHAMFVDDNDTIWIIGGIGEKTEAGADTYLNDVWQGKLNKFND